jgi:cell shape-determining protein MreD
MKYAVILIFLGLASLYWPLLLCAIAIFGVYGRWFLAILCGLLMDVIYAPVIGIAHVFILPFTFFAVLFVLARMLIFPHLRPGSPYHL